MITIGQVVNVTITQYKHKPGQAHGRPYECILTGKVESVGKAADGESIYLVTGTAASTIGGVKRWGWYRESKIISDKQEEEETRSIMQLSLF